MTSAKVVETSVNVTNNSSQDYTHPDDLISSSLDMTPGFKSFANYIKKTLSILAEVDF